MRTATDAATEISISSSNTVNWFPNGDVSAADGQGYYPGGYFTKALTSGSSSITQSGERVTVEITAGELENVGMGVEGAAKAASSNPIDPNRLLHIFEKSKHNVGGLVEQFESQEAAFNAVQEAAREAYEAGQLTVDPNGILPNGDNGNLVSVAGTMVRLFGGRIVNGKVLVSSLSRKGRDSRGHG